MLPMFFEMPADRLVLHRVKTLMDGDQVSLPIDAVAGLIEQLGTAQFDRRFFLLFQEMLDVEHCAVFSAKCDYVPRTVVAEASTDCGRDLAQHLAATYVAGAYAEDPNFGPAAPVDALSVVTKQVCDYPQGSYRSFFYEQPGLASELIALGEIDKTVYYVSLSRGQNKRPFSGEDCRRMTNLADFTFRILHKHSRLALGTCSSPSSSAADRPRMLHHLKERLLLEPGKLSAREAEICAGIILGYTTLGLSLNLGISLNTVATHRKRAYTKLRVCSQSELFLRYLEATQSCSRPASEVASLPPYNRSGGPAPRSRFRTDRLALSPNAATTL